jgi:hypothetical protein
MHCALDQPGWANLSLVCLFPLSLPWVIAQQQTSEKVTLPSERAFHTWSIWETFISG